MQEVQTLKPKSYIHKNRLHEIQTLQSNVCYFYWVTSQDLLRNSWGRFGVPGCVLVPRARSFGPWLFKLLSGKDHAALVR